MECKQSTIAGFWAVLWEGRGKGYAQGWLSRRRDLKVRAEQLAAGEGHQEWKQDGHLSPGTLPPGPMTLL